VSDDDDDGGGGGGGLSPGKVTTFFCGCSCAQSDTRVTKRAGDVRHRAITKMLMRLTLGRYSGSSRRLRKAIVGILKTRSIGLSSFVSGVSHLI